MLIPMEILSQMVTRADSGVDTRQKTSVGTKSDSVFSKIIEESRAAMDYYEKLREAKAQSEIPDDEDVEYMMPRKSDRDKRTEEAENLIAGVMGYRNMVVFILEGDKESDTTPEICVDSIEMDAADGIEYTVPETAEGKEEVDAKPEQTAAEAKPDETAAAGAETEQVAITATEVKNAAEAKAPVEASDAETPIADAENETAVAATETAGAGEVEARKPEIRTSEQRKNADNSSDFSSKGDLGPLENENDTVPIAKGQKEKTNTGTEENAENSEGDTQGSVNNVPIAITDSIRPERFQASEQMRRTADAPVRAEGLFDEMVSRIEAMDADTRQTVTIQLKPEFLGNVALEIAMDAAGLHVKINAANSDVRTMINGQINALIESLENKGIEVVEVEVAYTGVDNGAFKDSHNNHAQQDRPRRAFRMDRIEDGAAYYAALPFGALDYYLDAGVSSVEYSA